MPPVEDAIAIYRAGTEANDLDRFMSAIAPDGELHSPLSGRMVFKGSDDLRVLLGAVYSTLRDLRWNEEVGDEAARPGPDRERLAYSNAKEL
jgi:hypothetical protein